MEEIEETPGDTLIDDNPYEIIDEIEETPAGVHTDDNPYDTIDDIEDTPCETATEERPYDKIDEIEETPTGVHTDDNPYDKIDEIIKNEDSISRTIAKEFRLNTEKKVIEEIKKNNDLSLLKRVYGNLSKPNQVILDDLRPVVTKYNDVALLKKRIHDIEYYTQFSKYDEALDLLNKSYPNEYPESLPENIILKDMLRNILIDKDISKISSIINSNDDIGQFIDEVNEILDKYKNQSLSSSQKYEIENFKKQFISKRIESVKDYVNGGGYSINEINSLLQLGKNEISTSQKKTVQTYKIIAEKNWTNEQSRRSSSNKDDEISTSYHTCSYCTYL